MKTKLNDYGYGLIEAITAGALLVVLVGVSTTFILQKPAENEKRAEQNNSCLNLATAYMDKLAEGGLVSRPLNLTNGTTILRSGEAFRRTLGSGESLPGIPASHYFPNGVAANVIDSSTSPVGLRHSQLHRGVMATLQAIYNSDARFCTSAQPYAPAGIIEPLIPATVTDLAWRGNHAGQTITANLSIKIETYVIDTGDPPTGAGGACPLPPIFLQPQGATEPESAVVAGAVQRPSNVFNDRGFAVTINVNYASVSAAPAEGQVTSPNQNLSGTCSLTRKFQHQRKAILPMQPTLTMAPAAADQAHNSCQSIAQSASVSVRFGYDANHVDSTGSVLWCRDRSVRLKPTLIDPATETLQRGIALTDRRGSEICITGNGTVGGLSGGQVNGCFTDRAEPGGVSPWRADGSADPTYSDRFYFQTDPSFALSRLAPINQWVPCDQLRVCRVTRADGTVIDSPRNGDMAIEKSSNQRIEYAMQFTLSKDQAGCYAFVDVAAIDTAYNMSPVAEGVIREALLEQTTDPNLYYCFDRGMGLFGVPTLYANCHVPSGTPYPSLSPAATAGPLGKDFCSCATDRFWYRDHCERVDFDVVYPSATSYYSEDGTQNALIRTLCANKVSNSLYTGSGGGQDSCPYLCDVDYYDPNYPPQQNPGAASCALVGEGWFAPVGSDDRRLRCTDGPANYQFLPVATRRAATDALISSSPYFFRYTTDGNGSDSCAWACLPGYSLSGGICTASGTPTPTPSPPPTATPTPIPTPTPTPTPTPSPTPCNCSAEPAVWGGGNCSGTLPVQTCGLGATITDTTGSFTGVADYTCNSPAAAWTIGSASCNPTPTPTPVVGAYVFCRWAFGGNKGTGPAHNVVVPASRCLPVETRGPLVQCYTSTNVRTDTGFCSTANYSQICWGSFAKPPAMPGSLPYVNLCFNKPSSGICPSSVTVCPSGYIGGYSY